MELIEAKEAVAFKYFREKWVTLSLTEKVKHMDEVAELYAETKVKNVSSNSCVSGSLPTDEVFAKKQKEVYDEEGNKASYWFDKGVNWLKSEIAKVGNDR